MQGGITMVRIWKPAGNACTNRFSEPPLNEQSDEWLHLDERLPLDHLAREIDQMVARLNLSSLAESYANVGKKAYRPDLMVKIV